MPKSIQKSQFINFSAKMDDRTNSEVVNLSPNENGIAFHYLENADLYYTKALRNRLGTQDLCDGIVNFSYNENCWYNITGTSVSGSVVSFDLLPQYNVNLFDYPVTVFIPSGNQILSSTSLEVFGKEFVTNYNALVAAGEQDYQIQINANLYELIEVPISANVMSGINQFPISNTVSDLALGGTKPTPPYPQYSPVGANSPIAIASAVVSLGDYFLSFPNYQTATKSVELPFDAPAFVYSGAAYAIRYSWALTSGSIAKSMFLETITNFTNDLIPNAIMAQQFAYINFPVTERFAIRWQFSDKTYIRGTICELESTGFFSPEYPTSDVNSPFPIISGLNPALQPDVSYQGYKTSASIGQVLPLSGNSTLYGTYFWAGANHNLWPAPWTLYNSDGTLLTGSKSVGTVGRLYSIDSSTGAIVSGNYSVTGKTLLAEGSGTYTFDFGPYAGNTSQEGYITDEYKATNNGMSKVYNMFSNPVTINASGENYLMTFDLYDTTTGGPYNDYSRYSQTTGRFFVQTASALRYASQSDVRANYSGAAVLDYSGNGTYNQFSDVYTNQFYGPMEFDLTCGILDVPSGNAVVGIYDYRIGSDRSSKIVYGQAGDIRYFDLDTPSKSTHVTIHSGISTLNNSLMSFVTYDDLLFMTDYSQVSGLCWDQVNSGTMIHGLRPTCSYSGTSGTGGTIPSGVPFSIMLGADMSSGGIRTKVYNLTSGTASPALGFLEISGLANQYVFDSPASNMTVYVTEASGANYYVANLYSGATTASTLYPYPLPSGVDVAYLQRLALPLTDTSFPTATNYPLNYAISQVDTPKMKYLQVFYDYILGIGDPDFSSRLWYSEQYAPQIWGESFSFHGFIDVDKDNGSPLTGMVPLREYCLLFKKNSTYRIEFLGSAAEPFSITQISSKIGSIGSFGLATVGDTVYGLCEYGIFSSNGSTVQIISEGLDPFFASLDHTDLTFSSCIHNMHEDKIIWSISNEDSSPDKNTGIMFNYKEGSFSVRKGSTWNACNVIHDDDSFDVLVGGTTMGQIQIIDDSASTASGSVDEVLFNDGNGVQATNTVVMTAETPWLSVLDSQIKKEFRYIDFNIEKADTMLKIDVYFDEDSTNLRYTRYINLNTNNPDKRCHLGGKAKTIKFVFSNAGNPAFVKFKSMNLYFTPLGIYEEL